MRLSQFQQEMSKALDDTAEPSPALLSTISPQTLGPNEALDIYKNNVRQNLREALEDCFPLTRLLLGTEYFSYLIALYIQNFPCRSSDLNFYGREFPDFAASQAELKELVYLRDFIELEFLYQEVYYAPENKMRQLKCEGRKTHFQKLLEAPPEKTYLHLSPSVRLLSSSYPLLDIWQYCLKEEEQETQSAPKELKLKSEVQNIVLYRKETEVYLERLDEVWPLLKAISTKEGASLAQLSLGFFAKHKAAKIIEILSFVLERELLS